MANQENAASGQQSQNQKLLEATYHKAKYGRKDWVTWVDKNGVRHAEVQSAAAVKRALLDIGTKRKFNIISGKISMIYSWRTGLNILNHYKRGTFK